MRDVGRKVGFIVADPAGRQLYNRQAESAKRATGDPKVGRGLGLGEDHAAFQ